eukprot:scaffold47040_cov57-Phaeocystis_antarctica.AAC.2
MSTTRPAKVGPQWRQTCSTSARDAWGGASWAVLAGRTGLAFDIGDRPLERCRGVGRAHQIRGADRAPGGLDGAGCDPGAVPVREAERLGRAGRHLCRKQGLYGRPARSQAADWPRLAGA